MLEEILSNDTALFLVINAKWTNQLFDAVLPFMRNEWSWVPLYIGLILFFVIKYKLRGLWWVLCCALTVIISDLLSSQLIKKTVMRPRPCHIMEELTALVLRVDCGTGYSYTSSHATNHMALAIFIVLTTVFAFKHWRWIFVPWALIIGYAQIYVGVHYPLDVFSGYLLGGLVGATTGLLFHKYISLSKPQS